MRPPVKNPSAVNADRSSGESPSHDPFKGPFSRPELRIAALYILLASIWIIGSDALLEKFRGSATDNWFTQSSKGLNFVVTTGVLLYLVLRRAYGGWRSAEKRRITSARAAIQTLRQLSTRVEYLREEERTRISREVHDELGQLLTGIKMQLRLIENRLSDRDDRTLNPLIDELVEISGTIDQTINSVRRIAVGLRPMELDQLGLAPALDEEARRFTRRTGIDCRLTFRDLDVQIPPDVGTAAFRIFQELLTNVARHAKARRVQAECTLRDGMLTLRLCDDGVGIAPNAVLGSGSLGLVGMRERAAGVGGSIEFTPMPGHGTEALLKIPLPGKSENPGHDSPPT